MGTLPMLRVGFDQDVASGGVFGPDKVFQLHGHPVKVRSNARSHDIQAPDALWHKSEELTGVRY